MALDVQASTDNPTGQTHLYILERVAQVGESLEFPSQTDCVPEPGPIMYLSSKLFLHPILLRFVITNFSGTVQTLHSDAQRATLICSVVTDRHLRCMPDSGSIRASYQQAPLKPGVTTSSTHVLKFSHFIFLICFCSQNTRAKVFCAMSSVSFPLFSCRNSFLLLDVSSVHGIGLLSTTTDVFIPSLFTPSVVGQV
jgi:hypothetical protein